jgi:hypothetical protein
MTIVLSFVAVLALERKIGIERVLHTATDVQAQLRIATLIVAPTHHVQTCQRINGELAVRNMEQVLYVDVGVPHAHVILVEVVVELSDTTNILSKLIANVGTDTTIVR